MKQWRDQNRPRWKEHELRDGIGGGCAKRGTEKSRKIHSNQPFHRNDRPLSNALTLNGDKTVDERGSHLVHIRRLGVFDRARIFLEHGLLAGDMENVFFREVDAGRVCSGRNNTGSNQYMSAIADRW